jgi:lipoate-protein ligase B
MAYWEGIIGCGLAGYPVTSLAEWVHPKPAMQSVQEAVIEAFGSVLGYRMVEKAYA